eukprot:COSAG04_NODE_1530_length_6451_cov_2.039830_1_plen_341_part_00
MVSHRRLRGISCALRAGAVVATPVGSEGGEAALIEQLAEELSGGNHSRRQLAATALAEVAAAARQPAAPAPAGGRWQTMLEQGRDMAVRSGSFAAVAAAVARGADLRLYMSTDTYGTFYEEVMNFKQTLCRPDSERFSGLGPFLSSVHHGRDIEAPFASFFNYDTCRGALEGPTHSLIKWLPDGTKLDESNYDPQTPANYDVYRWFVRDRFRTVFEHDASGAVVSGSKEELKECVRAGLTIRVGIWQLSGLEEDEDEEGDSGSGSGSSSGSSSGSDSASGPAELTFLETSQPFMPVAHEGSRSFFGREGAAGEVNLSCDPVRPPPPPPPPPAHPAPALAC